MKLSGAAIGLLAFALFGLFARAAMAADEVDGAEHAHMHAQCHVHSEALSENIRALEEHDRPCDLRDVARLLRNGEMVAARAHRPGSARLKRQSAPSGIIYVYRCPVCFKLFRRTTMNPQLNPHNSKGGWPCPGTNGFLVKTDF